MGLDGAGAFLRAPYSSAKDPVNYAGYVAANILDGLVETVNGMKSAIWSEKAQP